MREIGRCIGILGVAVLAACGGSADEAARPETPPATDTPAPAPEPARGLALRPDGIGPVRVGQTLEEAATALGEPGLAPDAEHCGYARPAGVPDGVWLMVVNDTVVRIDVTTGVVASAAGIRIGDSEAEVEAAHPGGVSTQPHKYTDGHYLVVAGADTLQRMVYETDGRAVTSMRSGRLPAVLWVEGCS